MKDLTDLKKCQILLGNFYGDGNYSRNKKYQKARYILSKHSSVENEYVEYLEDLYKQMNIFQFVTYNKINRGGYLGQNLCSYIAAKPPIIDFFESSDFTDENHRKIITQNGLRQLDTFGLLLWYLDDGSLGVYKNKKGSKRHARLSTQCYSYDEHLIIQKVFKDKWNLNTKIYNQRNSKKGTVYNYIYFNCIEFKKFFELMIDDIPYIPDCMVHKFDMQYSDKNSKYNLL